MVLGGGCDPGLVLVSGCLLTAICWCLDGLPFPPGARSLKCRTWQQLVQQLQGRQCRDSAGFGWGAPRLPTWPHLSSCCSIRASHHFLHLVMRSSPSPAAGPLNQYSQRGPVVRPPTLSSAYAPWRCWGQLRKAELKASLVLIRLLYFSMTVSKRSCTKRPMPISNFQAGFRISCLRPRVQLWSS